MNSVLRFLLLFVFPVVYGLGRDPKPSGAPAPSCVRKLRHWNIGKFEPRIPPDSFVARAAERMLRFPEFDEIWEQAAQRTAAQPDTPQRQSFIHFFLEALNLKYRVRADLYDLNALADSPLVIIANHPTGGVDGMILTDWAQKTWPGKKTKLVATKRMSLFPELHEDCIFVNPGVKDPSNSKGTREMIALLKKENGSLILFPPGKVGVRDENGTFQEVPWMTDSFELYKRANATFIVVQFTDLFNPDYYYKTSYFGQSIPPENFDKFRDVMFVRAMLSHRNKLANANVQAIIRPEDYAELSGVALAAKLRDLVRYSEDLETYGPTPVDTQ